MSDAPTPSSNRYPAGGNAFPHKDLIGIAPLAPWEIHYLLDEAEQWVRLNRQPAKHADALAGLTIINAFFENSTRTLLSFEIAGKRLGADVVNMHAAQSSVKKGETLIDTATTLNAMRADAIVIRHCVSPGAVQLIADKVDCPVLNAGDGQHEHPTQALLDALTMRLWLRSDAGPLSDEFAKLKITICGDILHSRVARSNILLPDDAGCRSARLRPARADARRDRADEGRALSRFRRRHRRRRRGHDAAPADRADGRARSSPRPREYRHLLRPDARAAEARRARCAGDAPRTDEPRRGDRFSRSPTCSNARRSPRQVEMGVAMRMACLDVLTRRARGVEGWNAL